MSNKRKINDKSASNNKLKKSVPVNDLNTLIAMPEEILDQIFNTLEFQEKKKFSEVCKKFNSIFGLPKNLKKIWLLVDRDFSRRMSKVNRSYTNRIISYYTSQFAPRKLLPGETYIAWDPLKPTVTRLKIVGSTAYMWLDELTIAMSYFANLTHLEIDLERLRDEERGDGALTKLRDSKKEVENVENDGDLITMNNLVYLRMNIDLFCALNRRYINFKGINKLRTLQLNACRDFGDNLTDLNTIRTFIGNQTELQSLGFYDDYISSLFDEPLKVQSQLKHLTFLSSGLFNEAQQINFFEFVFAPSGSGLKSLHTNPDFSIPHETSSKLAQLRLKILDIPLIQHNILLRSPLAFDDIKFKEFKFTELSNASKGQENLTTTRLKFLAQNDRWLDMKMTILCLAQKFPNMTSIDINLCSKDEPKPQEYATNSIEDLSDFKHLKHLKLNGIFSIDLKNLTVPKLESFEFESLYKVTFRIWNLFEFIGRHGRIRKLRLNLRYPLSFIDHEQLMYKLVAFSLENLKEIDKITLHSRNCYYGVCKRENHAETLKCIRDQAKIGFVLELLLEGSRFKIFTMKRDDGEIVQAQTTFEPSTEYCKWKVLPA